MAPHDKKKAQIESQVVSRTFVQFGICVLGTPGGSNKGIKGDGQQKR